MCDGVCVPWMVYVGVGCVCGICMGAVCVCGMGVVCLCGVYGACVCVWCVSLRCEVEGEGLQCCHTS